MDAFKALVPPTVLGVAAGLLTLGFAAPAMADGPGVGTPTIVAMGDSTVSGEAGRWAGNTTFAGYSAIDALGPTAYWDTPNGESVPGCDRSRSAEVHIGKDGAGDPVNSLNLACSGSMTTTWDVSGQPFKPGLDNFWDVSIRNGESQSLLLADYARTHNVKAIVVRVGANDLGFNTIVSTCFTDWLTYWLQKNIGLNPSHQTCSQDPDLDSRFTPAAQAALKQKVFQALKTIASDMSDVGYAKSMYSVIVETYYSPIPPAALNRYPQESMQRQTYGGCGIFNADEDWLNNTVLPTLNTALRGAAALFAANPNYPPVHILDDQYALNGHRLCETGTNLIEDTPYQTWSAPGAMNALEWVNQLRTVTTLGGSPYLAKEGVHANYFGQLAERNCLRQEYNNGDPVDATCYQQATASGSARWQELPPTGSSSGPGTVWTAPPVTVVPGEPVMTLGPLAPQAAPQ